MSIRNTLTLRNILGRSSVPSTTTPYGTHHSGDLSRSETIILQDDDIVNHKTLLSEINNLISIHDIEMFKQYVPKSMMSILSDAVITVFGGVSPMISVWSSKSSPTTVKRHDVEIMLNMITRSIMESECDKLCDVTQHLERFAIKNNCRYYLVMDADRFMYLLIGINSSTSAIQPIRQYFVPFVSKYMRNTIRSAHNNAIPIIHAHVYPHLQGLLDISRLLNDSDLTKKQKQYVAKIQECNLELLSVMNDMSDYYHYSIVQGKPSMRNEPFFIARVFENICHVVGNRLRKNKNELSYKINYHTPFVYTGDDKKISQLIINCILFLNSHVMDSMIDINVSYDVGNSNVVFRFGIENGQTYGHLNDIISQATAIDMILYMTKSFSDAVAFRLLELLGGRIELNIPKDDTLSFRKKTDVNVILPLRTSKSDTEKQVLRLVAMKHLRNLNFIFYNGSDGSMKSQNIIVSIMKEYDAFDNLMISHLYPTFLTESSSPSNNIVIIDLDNMVKTPSNITTVNDVTENLLSYCHITAIIYVGSRYKQYKKRITDRVYFCKPTKKNVLRQIIRSTMYQCACQKVMRSRSRSRSNSHPHPQLRSRNGSFRI